MHASHAPPLAIDEIAPSFNGLLGTDGRTYSLSSFDDKGILIIMFMANRCTAAQAYTERIAAIQDEYRERGVQIVAINSDDPGSFPSESYLEMVKAAEERGYSFPYLKDEDRSVAQTYGAQLTLHVFLLDEERRLRYRGRIDSSPNPAFVTTSELRDALDDILAGREVRVEETMVVGESGRGWIRTFNTLYYPLRLYLTGRLRTIPIDPSAKVNLVPGDTAADAIVRITLDPRGTGRTAHLVPPSEDLPTVRELVDLVREWAASELDTRLPRARFIDLPQRLSDALIAMSGRVVSSRGGEGDMRPIMSYLQQGQTFRRDTMDELIGREGVDWKDVTRKALAFGTRYGFMHRSERTVHEQVLFRLGRQHRKVRLFDVIGGQRVERDAVEVRNDIMRAARALVASGIAKGDKVAVVGYNSTRYLVIETAIGLAGAVSVPLYYTSPDAEVRSLVEDSGAKMLFIGCPAFDKVPNAVPEVECVSFARTGKMENAVGWSDFLGRGDADIPLPQVGFDDLATIRYTSGTTGRPRGVVFDHGNLRWMAETIASLPPWEARNREVSYLSFLPMNHVVEGILGTYSPYYAPAPLDLSFLEEFRSLRPALKDARPSVFFSVPRFYEKLWDSFEDSTPGSLHARLGSSPAGRWAKRGLGSVLLKQAGLDRCSQLIVGSAPCGNGLLEDLRSLGIEVHNAYGLTEAPLITLNRVGRNRIGTVGEPLPETDVTMSGEGEVMVQGRQVMRGYHPLAERRENGPLATGDLGRMTPEGSLVIEGRIKEVMISSYGKNIMLVIPVADRIVFRAKAWTRVWSLKLVRSKPLRTARSSCLVSFWSSGRPFITVGATVLTQVVALTAGSGMLLVLFQAAAKAL